MVDISDMLFIVGHVGHIWRSWETKLFETITKSKVFETNTTTFSRTNFFRSLLRLFLDQNFWDPSRDFFWDQSFRDRYWDFFRDLIFSRPILRLFSRPKFLRPRTILSKNWEKSPYREVLRRDVTLWVKASWSSKLFRKKHLKIFE